jgi:anti-anti-sigma factor
MLTDGAEATTAEDIVMAAQGGLERTTPLAMTHRIRPTGEAVVELTGDLDIATAELAVSYVTDVIRRHHRPLTIDLSALDFCDAKGLAAFVRMAGYAEQKDRPFQLASPLPSLIKIMRITGLDRRFSTAQIPPLRQLPLPSDGLIHRFVQLDGG